MMKMIKVKNRSNPTIDQIRDLIRNKVPSVLGYNTEYFMGRHPDNLKMMLCFEVNSKVIGNIYRKIQYIKIGGPIEDDENLLIGHVLADFVMLGLMMLTDTINKNQNKPHINLLSKDKLNNFNLN